MKLKTVAIGTTAVTFAALAAAGPALATGNAYTVSVGGSSAPGTHAITATAGAINFTVPAVSMTCDSANVPATPSSNVFSGTGILDIALINKINFVNCQGPGGALTVVTSGSWKLHGESTATAGATDAITGHVENVTAQVTNLACDFTVQGSARGTFNEATQKLDMNEPGGTSGSLKVAAVNPSKSCFGLVKVGDTATFSGVFTVASADGVINASS